MRSREVIGRGPLLYAQLRDAPGLPIRVLSYRADEWEEPVPVEIMHAPAGTAVLLSGGQGCWRSARRVQLTPWADAPSVDALRAGRQRTPVLLVPEKVRGGVWSADEQGRACELGDYDTEAHGVVGVVSYAGWRLSDLGGAPLEAIETRVGSFVYYVLPSRSVPEMPVSAPGARGELSLFAKRARYLERIVKERRWRSVGEVLGELEMAPDESGVLSIPELGFDRRKEAFTRLLRLRDPSRAVHIQPNEGVLIPVSSAVGPPFWVWEVVEEGHATYLFRPRTQVLVAQMFEWLGSPQSTRRALLESADLQQRVGFVGRVIHREIDEPLDEWWERLCAALERRVDAG